MPENCIYLLHPQETFLPGIAGWIGEFQEFAASEQDWFNWDLVTIPYDEANSFTARDVYSRVAERLGPVVMLENVQTSARERLRKLLRYRSVVVVTRAGRVTDILDALLSARERFIAGEPFLPRKFVVAILILRKLINGDYWGGGAKNKAYAYADELAKGRGVDEQFADVAKQVANDLFLHDLLLKKPSKGRKKYALNPTRRADIHSAAEECEFPERLQHLLKRDTSEVSAKHLQ
ncbi:MAG: hypothetical protein RIC55_26545 [Pirellulaceae bacterium]